MLNGVVYQRNGYKGGDTTVGMVPISGKREGKRKTDNKDTKDKILHLFSTVSSAKIYHFLLSNSIATTLTLKAFAKGAFKLFCP
jgi:hypothetical protein